ncbi:hypothetical protein LTR28_005525 [Elasticomyces elasticus]|nr:hypothetical protein LTR28_005525 [Elasticomyces elasticus]
MTIRSRWPTHLTKLPTHVVPPYDLLPADDRESGKLSIRPVITSICAGTKDFLIFLVPSFLRRSDEQPTLHAVACLDGLRGYASFGVFTLHFTDTFCQMHNMGWGHDENSHYIFQLPFIHFLWTAPALVACFFVISGYVLSYKPVKLIRARSEQSLLRTMGSSIFRRGIRLYLPTFFATFITLLLVRAGAFDYSHWVFVQGGYLSSSEDTPPILDTFGEQFWHWWGLCLRMLWDGGGSDYDPHLWTIPTEFHGSMLLFVFTVGTSALRTPVRLALSAALIFYFSWHDSNEIPLFFGGMFLAEIDLVLHEHTTTTTTTNRPLSSRLRHLWLLPFATGLYLAGMPSWDPQITPGYATLMALWPNWFRWHTVGCLLLVWSVRNARDLHPLFTNRFAQYLGRISYALYIVHGNVRRSVTYALMPALLAATGGRESKVGFAGTVLVESVVTYALTFWLADLFWRAVDLPSIRFARWVEGKCSRRVERVLPVVEMRGEEALQAVVVVGAEAEGQIPLVEWRDGRARSSSERSEDEDAPLLEKGEEGQEEIESRS